MAPRVSPEYTPYSTVKPEGPRMVAERVDINYPHVQFSNAVGRAMEVAGSGMQSLAGAQGAVARAFDDLGNQLERTGNQLWSRAEGLQELQNENARSKAELEFDKYVATKTAQFENNKGEAATEETYKAYVKDLEDQAKKLGEKLPPTTLKKYTESTMNQIGKRGIAAAGHVASQIRAVTIATSEARVNQWKDDLSKTDDINTTKELIEKIEKEITSIQAPAKGWSREILHEAIRKQVGEGYAGQLKNLARTNPWQAEKILDHPENKGMWDDKQYAALKQHILERQAHLTSRNVANDIQDKDPDGDLEKKLAEGDKRVEDLTKKIPEVKELTRHAIEERHHSHNRIVEERRREAARFATHILDGGGNPDGTRPKNLDQFYADGGDEARRAYENAGKDGQAKIRKQLNRNALGLVDPTPESEDLRLTLEGLKRDNPAKFRDLDLNSLEDLRLSDKKHFENLQKQMREKGIKLEDDPHVGTALSKARANGWIDRNLPKSPAKWEKFQGAFSDAIHAIQKQVGYDKELSDDQIKAITFMLQEKETYIGKKWGVGYNVVKEGDPLYQRGREVPEDVKNEILKAHPGISDNEILERYRRSLIQLEWSKKFAPKYAY